MVKRNFNKDWIFRRGSSEALAEVLAGGAADERRITLPHDASIEISRDPLAAGGSGNGYFQEGNYQYTKVFYLEPEDSDKNIWFEFEGVYQNAFVYINNSYAGKCPYGYGNFFIDATNYVLYGQKNTIRVVVKNDVPSGRWYTGGGIYRNVNLMVADRLHLIKDGIHLTVVNVEEELAVVQVDSVVEYTGTGVQDAVLRIEVFDGEGQLAAEDEIPVTVKEHTRNAVRQKLYVRHPQRWDVDHPYLYTYRAQIMREEHTADEEKGTFGIRTVQLDIVHGLRINGREVKLRGGCIHHDNGIIGAAEFRHAEEIRIRKLKAAGYNAVRSAHYPMSRTLLEVCDREGMLVMDEYADVWTRTKMDFDYGMAMTEWWEKDIANMVNKDYNHPCVIMYSIGNEIAETGNRLDVEWGRKLTDKIRSMDSTRYVTNSINLMLSVKNRIAEILMEVKKEAGNGACDAEQMKGFASQEINNLMSNLGELMNVVVANEIVGKATEEASSQVDIVGYNYADVRYEQDVIRYRNRIIVGSETFPGNLDKNWKLVEIYPQIIGDFVWAAWDYLGEAGIGQISYGDERLPGLYAGYPYKAAYCGDFNLIGDRRPVSYWREIVWRLRKAPYIAVQPPMYFGMKKHISNWSLTDAVRSWNWKGYEGKPVIVEVYADADRVALYHNGHLTGECPVGERKTAIAEFELSYLPGRLEAVAYHGGRVIGRDELHSADDFVQICADTDRKEIPADQSDICYVDISMRDREGRLNPEAGPKIAVAIEGPGRLLGYGSADPKSQENYFDREAVPFEGRLRAAVRATGEKGMIRLVFTAPGLDSAEVEINAV